MDLKQMGDKKYCRTELEGNLEMNMVRELLTILIMQVVKQIISREVKSH